MIASCGAGQRNATVSLIVDIVSAKAGAAPAQSNIAVIRKQISENWRKLISISAENDDYLYPPLFKLLKVPH